MIRRAMAAALTAAALGAGLARATCAPSDANRWATLCYQALAAEGARPRLTDPWQDLGPETTFTAAGDLAAAYAATCDRLAAAFESLPPERRTELAAQGWPMTGGCTVEERRSWLRACVGDAEVLGAGARRATLTERFDPDGGLTSSTEQRFVHRACSVLMLAVRFAPGAAQRRNDRIAAVKIYIGPRHTD